MKQSILEKAFADLKLLNEIGKVITANLSVEKIIEIVYNQVNSLMDANVFGIGIYNDQTQSIEFKGAKEKGNRLPDLSFHVQHEKERLSVVCYNQRKTILINDFAAEFQKYTSEMLPSKTGEHSKSIMYVPLTRKDTTLGVITVQSFKKNMYSAYDLNILNNIAIYTSIALENAAAYEELSSKSTKLSQTVTELKETQNQLIQSEKLATLGELTAGVAHELNNPINFIYAGITSMQNLMDDLFTLLSKYQRLEHTNKETLEHHITEIKHFKSEIYYEEMLQNIQELSAAIKEGAVRTYEIAKGLKDFSKEKDMELHQADIHELIDKTLLLLKAKLSNIVIHKNYDPELSVVECYKSSINQVLLNIFDNSIYSLQGKGNISISTRNIGEKYQISIKDDGQGMDKETQKRVFEPFYTTKSPGVGTGLGLSISYKIIKNHHGDINLKSRKGHGAEFIITLPKQVVTEHVSTQ